MAGWCTAKLSALPVPNMWDQTARAILGRVAARELRTVMAYVNETQP
jgi:hypothetical protein